MFRITNISANPLTLSTGERLAPGEGTSMKTVGDTERKYERRSWLRIIDTTPPVPAKEPAKEPVKEPAKEPEKKTEDKK